MNRGLAHLYQGSRQEGNCEERTGQSVASFHQMYNVYEDELAGHDQKKQNLSRSMVCSCHDKAEHQNVFLFR